MSASPTSVRSLVTCPDCSHVTDIYQHVNLGYNDTEIFHIVQCRVCGSHLKVVTMFKGHFLAPEKLRASLVRSNRQPAQPRESGAPNDRPRSRLP